MPAQPTAARLQDHLQALAGERNPHTSAVALRHAGSYISRQFRSLGLRVEEEPVPFESGDSLNILGYREGAGEKDEFILAAHYDTVTGTPGADDNASAVAALLEIARCMESVPLRHPLIFAGFTLEEYGLAGSGQFARNARKNDQRLKGMISMEMLGYRDRRPGSQTYPAYVDPGNYPDSGDFIAVVGNEPSGELASVLTAVMRRTVPGLPVECLVLPGRGDRFTEVRLSDHAPFWDNGYPAVMVTDTAFFRNPHYHRATDTVETLDIEFIRDTAAGVAGFLKHYLM